MSRRAIGTGAVKQTKSGSWEARLTLGKRRDGTAVYRYKTFKTKRAADAWLADSQGLQSRAVTFQTYAERWLEHQKARVQQGELAVQTFTTYRNSLRHLVGRLGRRDMTAIRPRDIELVLDASEVLNQWTAAVLDTPEGKEPRTLGKASFQKQRAVLHNIFTRAHRDGIVTSNPVALAAKQRASQSETKQKGLTADQVQALIQAARGTKAEAFITLALATGARPSELLALTWSDIDFQESTVRLNASLGRLSIDGPLTRKALKTSKSRRTLPVASSALDPLRDRIGEPDAFVFATNSGAPIDIRDFARREFAPVVEAAGLTGVTLYTLRHAHATMLMRAGVAPVVAAARLGHSSTKLILDVYSHAESDLQKDAADRIAGVFDTSKAAS